MNLRKLLPWSKPAELPVHSESSQSPSVSNVVALPTHIESIVDRDSTNNLGPEKLPPIKGLLNAPELKKFFDENYFGLGKHNGFHFKSKDALELGKKSIISKFQKDLYEIQEDKYAKIGKLKNQMIAIDGLSLAMTQQLEKTCLHLEREIAVITDQIDKSNHQLGWVLEALNRYELGYMKGLSEALDFEALIG